MKFNKNVVKNKSSKYFVEFLQHDPELHNAIKGELNRQRNSIELIASENFVSEAILYAQGTILTNKYAEGYPGKRYYGGCEEVDKVEELAIERAKKLFKCKWANVQPNSGSQANQAVMLALLKPGEKILGMSLADGGHLTHGAKPNLSGKWFNAVQYGVSEKNGTIDYEALSNLVYSEKPKLVICGASAYSRKIDFSIFRKISDKAGAYLLVDMAHYAGLISSGCYPDPLPHAHVCTTTTHKTLRGPRGGMIIGNDLEIGKSIDKAVFPGLQGGPLMHVIAAKAAAFGEALKPEFKLYSKQIIKNACVIAETLISRGIDIVSGGTDSHMFLIDLKNKNITGLDAEKALDRCGITCNKNTIPNDPKSPFITSGIRIGTAAITTRGFQEKECIKVGDLIADILDALETNGCNMPSVELAVKKSVNNLCERFPIYSSLD